MPGWGLKAQDQAAQAGEVECRVAPLQMIHRIEPMRLDGLPCRFIEWRTGRCLPKFTIGTEPPGPARDLCAFCWCQQAMAPPIELRA